MRIPCPYCGPRSHDEFVYHGDAILRRPEPTGAPGAEVERTFYEYVYVRDNPAGRHEELWFHAAGCHSWLVVERDTRTHAIFGARPANAARTGEPR
jgi:methylglutamate dehydrogenase subunit B